MKGLYLINNKKELTIGRKNPCDIVCNNMDGMSATHIRISMVDNEYSAYMCGRNGGYINGRFIRFGENVKLQFGYEIKIFDLRVLWMLDFMAIELCKQETELQTTCKEKHITVNLELLNDNTILSGKYVNCDIPCYSKAPRTFYSVKDEVIELDPPPEKHIEENQPTIMTIGPAFTMAIPMILGYGVSKLSQKSGGTSAFMYTGIITAISSACLGAIWAYTNIKNRSKQVLIAEKKRQVAYTRYVKDSESLIRERYNTNASTLRLMNPDISEYFSDGRKSSYNKFLLWQRNASDDDFLKVRLGVGDEPADIDISVPKDRFSVVDDELKTLPQRLKNKYSILKDVPKTVDLKAYKCVGIISTSKSLREERFLQFLISVAVTVPPTEVNIVSLFNENIISKEIKNAVRFLPHIISTHVTYLDEDVFYIIVTDDYEKIKRSIFQNNKCFIVVIADKFENLPAECNFIIQNEPQFSGYIKLLKNNAIRSQVYYDRITIDAAEQYSRIMQSIKVKYKDSQYILPEKVPYYELFDRTLNSDYIINEWNLNTTINDISAPIGICDNGEILELDIHEKKYGPHGLIGGMTGSGKSEILQTIILSLAVKYSPEDIGFFIIDYKGGGMAKLFESLPHVYGSISNLSGRDIYRAMVSVRSENERRQMAFNKVAVNNISDYQKLYKAGVVNTPIPHIVIIIDEFAELKREEPDFMKELISVARVGRSLGIHLILATQKPSGVVDDNIFSNSRFRICLRLQDRSDSMEMLHKPDAADIKNPGRAYLQVGNDEVYTEFQSAYTMEKTSIAGKNKIIKFYDENGSEYERIRDNNEYIESEPQLLGVIRSIKDAAKITRHVRDYTLWLEPLGNSISYENTHIIQDGNIRLSVPIGIYDDPTHQKQEPLFINIADKGHHIILGTLQSGKSTLILSISYALLNNFRNDYINLYFIDFSGGKLNPLKESLLCGMYIDEDNEQDIQKLILFLLERIEERKSELKGGNFLQLKDKKIPALILFIDGFQAFRDKTLGQFDKDIEYILKAGVACGVYVFATAVNISTQEMPKRTFDLFGKCIPLSLRDKYEYKEALSCQGMDFMMPDDIKGRGLAEVNGNICEFQSFLPVSSDNDFDMTAILNDKVKDLNKEIIESYKSENISKLVKTVPTIPKNLTIDTFIKELKKRGQISEKMKGKYDASVIAEIPIGFFEQTGKTYFLPYEKGLTVLISGRSKSGKTNLFNVIEKMGSMYALKQKAEYEDSEMGLRENSTEILEFENGMKVFVYDEKLSFNELSEIKKDAGDDPYVIHLGGALDRQNVADFSYIPYSKQVNLVNPGKGLVRKTSSTYEYGEIVVPKFINRSCQKLDDIC